MYSTPHPPKLPATFVSLFLSPTLSTPPPLHSPFPPPSVSVSPCPSPVSLSASPTFPLSFIHLFIFSPHLSTPVSPTPTPPPPRPLFSLYLPLTTDLIQCRPGSIGRAIGRALWCFYFFGSFLFHLLFQNFYGGGIKAGPANKSKGQNEWKPFFLVERHRLSGPSIFENIFFTHAVAICIQICMYMFKCPVVNRTRFVCMPI